MDKHQQSKRNLDVKPAISYQRSSETISKKSFAAILITAFYPIYRTKTTGFMHLSMTMMKYSKF